jgi:hypothetical protein
VLISAVLIGAVWFFLESSTFAITDIEVKGTAMLDDSALKASVAELLSRRQLYLFQPARNIILLDTAAVGAHLKDAFPAIADVQVTKKYPHQLDITVAERKPLGLWCRGQSCQLFDVTGARWGSALPSSGPLLLLVTDERADDGMDSQSFAGLTRALDGLPELGLKAKRVTLPNAEPGGIRIATSKNYDLLMDSIGDVDDQLAVLKVFLSDKAKDPAFAPQYIDLRTPGRVYYK